MFSSPDRQLGLLDEVSDAIIIRELNGRILYWNHGAEILYGWSREQAIGNIVHELLRTVFPVPRKTIEGFLRDRRNWEGDLRQTHRDGNPVTVSSRWAFWEGDENQVELLEINRDITNEMRLRDAFMGLSRELATRVEELQRSERRFRAFVELSPDAVVIASSSGQIVLVNSQAEKQFGYSRDELLGQSIDMLLPEGPRHLLPKHRNGYQSKPDVRPMGTVLDLYGLRKNGEEFAAEVSLSPVETGDGMFICRTIRDVSQRKVFRAG